MRSKGSPAVVPVDPASEVRVRADEPASPLGELGLAAEELAVFQQILSAERGLVLFAASPLGDATTTLRAAVDAIAETDRVVLVFERAADKLVVGRAVELAEGRLVLAGVRANDGIGALGCLTSLGVDMARVVGVLSGLIVHRSVKRLCPSCVERYAPTAADLRLFRGTTLPANAMLARPTGCPACKQSGRSGDALLLEMLNRRGVARAPTRWTFVHSAVARLTSGAISTEDALGLVHAAR